MSGSDRFFARKSDKHKGESQLKRISNERLEMASLEGRVMGTAAIFKIDLTQWIACSGLMARAQGLCSGPVLR